MGFFWSTCSHVPGQDEDDGIEDEFPTFLREREDFTVETPLVAQESFKKEFLSPVVSFSSVNNIERCLETNYLYLCINTV